MKTWTTTAAAAIILMLPALTGCELLMATIKGSGTIITESRNVGDFDAVEISGAITARIVCRENESVEVKTDDNLVPFVETHVVDGTLVVSMKSGSYSPTEAVHVRITAPSVQSLDVAGACDVKVEAVQEDLVTVDVSGASKLNLEGRCRSLDVCLAGASRLDASELTCTSVDVDVSGASRAIILATESLAGEVSGASKLTHHGDATSVDVETSGASSVRAE